jgi:glycosyltransferase involved in cell wall biosynthesis
MKPLLGEKISVCLLTYNHVHVIDSTLKSILNQTIAGYEVFVSDDCSTDGTWEHVLRLAKQDARIRPLRTSRNIGMAANANFAVSHSQRPYIALLHHDDLYRNDLLEKWSGLLERHRDAGFVFNPYSVFMSDAAVDGESMPGERIDGRWLLENYLLSRWGCLVRGTAMIRREAWESLGGMREQFGLLADVDLWMRLAMRWAVGYVPEPVIEVRHSRPSYYPEIYKGNGEFWNRQRLLYEIHATNRADYLNRATALGRARWWWFRVKLSCETAKWLMYALLRGERRMIESSRNGATKYDLWPLTLLRTALLHVSHVERSLNA